MNSNEKWPPLDYNEWSDTLDVLHMKAQIAGKIKLALNPFLNQWWNVALHLNASGMTTGIIPYKNIVFEINFDFFKENVLIQTSDNESKNISLKNSAAEFYGEIMATLKSMGIEVEINSLPSELQEPIRFENDTRNSYDKEYILKWWRILLQITNVFNNFRSNFGGKSSPIHFFWGSFDLSGTRFSGKKCKPPMPGVIMEFAENEENYAFGFWAGNKMYPQAAFYSYLYPAPDGIAEAKINPAGAYFNKELGEFIMNYEDVRKSGNPEEMIMEFLNDTYNKSAKLSGWNLDAFECPTP